MTDIPDKPFDKIAIGPVSDLNVSASGKSTYTNYYWSPNRMVWGFLHPWQKADTIVCIFINNYLPIHMCPYITLTDNDTEFKNKLMDYILQKLGIDWHHFCIISPTIQWKLEVFFTNTLNLHLRSFVKRILTTGMSTSNKYWSATMWQLTSQLLKHHSS